MSWLFFFRPWRRAAVLGLAIIAGLGLCMALSTGARAATGPFAGFAGHWSGTGKVRTQDKTERIRCHANYRVGDSSGHQANLELTCKSDNYSFDLVGDFQADGSDHITGRWTERSRNIGGTVIGEGRGATIQILVESSAFAARLVMVTRGSRQAVSIDSHGGGQVVKASIELHRNSR
ncbi:MAG TPA: hypothetical protein VE224_10095 [Pseudolabrys sp.]|nr:hypothetical protein [Pseudolabrys sp.]